MSLPSVFGNDRSKDEAALQSMLSRVLPGSSGEDAADIPGMDGFVAVVRHICSCVDRDLMYFVASNDALNFAMADLSAETGDRRKRVQEYKGRHVRAVLVHVKDRSIRFFSKTRCTFDSFDCTIESF